MVKNMKTTGLSSATKGLSPLIEFRLEIQGCYWLVSPERKVSLSNFVPLTPEVHKFNQISWILFRRGSEIFLELNKEDK